jgi:fumarate hydratase class II
MSQSSNDVIPTTVALATVLSYEAHLKPQIEHLCRTITEKAQELGQMTKTGRTHLMDAMPVTFAQELITWEKQLRFAMQNLDQMAAQLRTLAQGGTAVGTGINAHSEFATKFCQGLSEATGMTFEPSDHFFELISAQDRVCLFSGGLKTLSVAVMKIANDLRWMNSGPLAGLAEIALPALQPGSSIMPGKVNPVIPESAAMVCAHVMGTDQSVTIACQSGNFQLNVMLPLIAFHTLENIRLLGTTCVNLADKAIDGFEVQEDQIKSALDKNPILVTALNRVIGYEKGAHIAKTAYAEKRSILDVASEQTELSREELEGLLNPLKLTQGGL